MTTQPSLFDFDRDDETARPPDQAARDFAVDPRHNVVLEASAGTGKTRVLVTRYVRLITEGVDPRHILAMTFTRKAAAEMRERVLVELRRKAEEGAIAPAAWRDLRDRVADIQISTIDAFCFGLLREFPLEADVDPAFEIADETEMARFAREAMDLTLAAARRLVVEDEAVRMLFARVNTPVLRSAIGVLLDRRHIAVPAVASFVRRTAALTSAGEAATRFVESLRDLLETSPHATVLLTDGPEVPEFQRLRQDLAALDRLAADPVSVQPLRRRVERYFLTKDGKARKRLSRSVAGRFASPAAKKRHEAALAELSPAMLTALDRLESDVGVLLAQGLLRVLQVAVERYERLLDEHALLDFAGMLARAVALLGRQEEFARSRLKLQARYHHLLVDEFQDTSRLQWRLVEHLIDAWGEGEGAADAPTSVFVVGDRKQSIYRFRHAEVTLLDAAARKIGALRPGRQVRKAISASFRAVPELQAFVNALAAGLDRQSDLEEQFRFGEHDRFPITGVTPGARRDGQPVVGLVAEPGVERCAEAVAGEVERLLAGHLVRDRSGTPRPARPDDIAILFRARAGHQYFEDALEARGIRTYVYKGLGFFDAPEVQDLQALLRCLARPESDLRAAEWLRSRFVRISDVGLVRLAPDFSPALVDPDFDVEAVGLDDLDRRLLTAARDAFPGWRAMADHVPPGEVLDRVLHETAYAAELAGRRLDQARENVKKVRALVRRVENRGYTTLDRLARYFETLRAGDESNAIVEAADAVNLMTIHAAKGLEFPIVFVVNLHALGRGAQSGFRVIESGPEGLPEVAFGASPATRLEDERDEEELRRLFYVAVTRARDRLYLASEVDAQGHVVRRPRSLASLLPPGLTEVFAEAVRTNEAELQWASPEGPIDVLICRATEAAARPVTQTAPDSAPPAPLPLRPGERVATGVTADVPARGTRPVAGEGGQAGDLLVGRVVHRLFERRLDPAADLEEVTAAVPSLVRDEELVDGPPLAELAARAADAYLALRTRAEVATLLASGTCHYEVPFSALDPERPAVLLRGSVDCLVVTSGAEATVLEFKTGQPRPAHRQQANAYVRALSAALPGLKISAKIVYSRPISR